MRAVFLGLVLALSIIPLAGSRCTVAGNGGEGEGEGGEGEGAAGEGEGAAGEGEGSAAEGEGAGEGEGTAGEGEGEGTAGEGEGSAGEGEGEAARDFACGTGGTLSTSSATSCTADSDCVAVNIEVDCCGSEDVTGVNTTFASGLQTQVDTCDAGWPACGCLGAAPTADDGSVAVDFSSVPSVTCVEGTCTTSFADRTFTCSDPNDPTTAEASCNAPSDCAIGSVLTDCCGSTRVTGVTASTLDAFTADADGCFVAVCDCVAQPETADDGHQENHGVAPTVDCIDHLCTTTFALVP